MPEKKPTTIQELLSIRRIPKIQWGEEFEGWDEKKQLAFAKKLADAMNEAARIMQDERDALAKEMQKVIALNASADQAVANHKSITVQQLTESNAEKQQLEARILELLTENKQLKKQLKA